ncbi:MAG: polysaccharide deacetylase family protein [Streptococcaceae bacterium]|jgi:peptidoglycan/xylan/chitin deacetylase (PgdA/CDA1 family)|nr:polysaccharide deacetylase family protein [Streptococcaceae bacterium]
MEKRTIRVEKEPNTRLPQGLKRPRRRNSMSSRLLILLGVIILAILALTGFGLYQKHEKSVAASESRSRVSSIDISQKVAAEESAAIKASESASVAADPTYGWLKTAGKPNELPILMFHYVAEETDNNQPAWNSNYITPESLSAICEALVANGYTTLTADQAVAVLTGNLKPSNKMVWLTFDDGHENNYTNAYPILKKYGIHASFGMVTATLPSYKGTDTTYISYSQMLKMQGSGLISFTSHTETHPDLSTLALSDEQEQLTGSKKLLDNLLHQNTQVLVYPSGKFDSETEKLAKEAGYKVALEEGEDMAVGSGNLFEVPRYRISTGASPNYVLSLLEAAVRYNTANTAH